MLRKNSFNNDNHLLAAFVLTHSQEGVLTDNASVILSATAMFLARGASEREEVQAELVQADRREEEVRQERRVLKKRCREGDGEVLLLQNRLEAAAQIELKSVRTELEIAQMHLAQLRGSEADAGSKGSFSDVASLTRELGLARNSQAEALASRDQMARERDLDTQGGRLSETREQINKVKKR